MIPSFSSFEMTTLTQKLKKQKTAIMAATATVVPHRQERQVEKKYWLLEIFVTGITTYCEEKRQRKTKVRTR
jgi:hypothetical protein